MNYAGEYTISDQPVEYVERKGKGHPDTLIDGIVERASINLGKAYKEAFGAVLHHNLDKGLIVGGEAKVGFGSGQITRPIEVIIAGRAAKELNGSRIDVDGIVTDSAREYLRENTRFLDLENEVRFVSKVYVGSGDLNGVFKRGDSMPLANDTSFGIGFAPLSDTERLALETERYLNSAAYKKKMPAVGEDIKVMGVREENNITLTVAVAFVSKFINNTDEYVKYREAVKDDVLRFSKSMTGKNVSAAINNGDSEIDGNVYITKSGLSCEAGDDGSVGRGNRVNGIITPFRHMSLEAAYGKNPINHVGKIYSVISDQMAGNIVKAYPEIGECTVYMVSQIGRRIDDPKNVHIDLSAGSKAEYDSLASKARDIAEETLIGMKDFAYDFVNGKYRIVG
ncbi:Methionine adenosyltransferase [mine drainage metagenome]|uniref:Methionine adenosyltransferase n=1 Tax=mine drainage metagenome TaxID=410659 RepID=T1B789_9ZZZZ